MKRFIPALCLVSACGTSQIGRPPEFTPVDSPAATVVSALSPQRLALAAPLPSVVQPSYTQSSLWRSGPTSLLGDRRAQTLGDILTVVIEIDDEAEIRNASDRERSGNEDMGITSFFGIPDNFDEEVPLNPAVGTSSTSGSSGSGSVRRNEEITLRVAATVIDVLPNGHLLVQGNQEVRVNFELRDLQVVGIVRPEDISRRNEITYDKIAGARIVYGGRGQITDVQQPRYGQQVLDQILPF